MAPLPTPPPTSMLDSAGTESVADAWSRSPQLAVRLGKAWLLIWRGGVVL